MGFRTDGVRERQRFRKEQPQTTNHTLIVRLADAEPKLAESAARYHLLPSSNFANFLWVLPYQAVEALPLVSLPFSACPRNRQ